VEQPCSALRSALNLCDKEDSVVVVRSQPTESHSCDCGMRLDAQWRSSYIFAPLRRGVGPIGAASQPSKRLKR